MSALDISVSVGGGDGIRSYYEGKINELEVIVGEKERNLVRLEAQRNELNGTVQKTKKQQKSHLKIVPSLLFLCDGKAHSHLISFCSFPWCCCFCFICSPFFCCCLQAKSGVCVKN